MVFRSFLKTKFMSRLCLVLIATTSIFLGSCELIEIAKKQTSKQRVSQSEIVSGLKEALSLGVDLMVDSAALNNGYWKRGLDDGLIQEEAIQILLPNKALEALIATQAMSSSFNSWKQDLSDNSFGVSDLIILSLDIDFINDLSKMETIKAELWKSLNRAAEHAAPKSKSIFVDAITEMSLNQGSQILFSDDSTSATQYLNTTSYQDLFDVFEPIVKNSLDQVNAAKLWNEYSSLYNNYLSSYKNIQLSINSNSLVPDSFKNSLKFSESFPETLPADLTEYTTKHALNGLFNLVAQEEVRIRRNPMNYVEDIIQNIFTLIEGEFIIEDE